MNENELVLDGELADLEEVVTQEPVTEATDSTDDSMPEYFKRNLSELGEIFIRCTTDLYENERANLSLEKVKDSQKILTELRKGYIRPLYFAQTININRLNTSQFGFIVTEGFSKKLLRDRIIDEYGPEIADAGFFEEMLLTGEGNVRDVPASTADYFPELNHLFEFPGKAIQFNPGDVYAAYLGLFTIPDLQARAFLTGAIAKSNPSEGKLIDGRHLSPTALDVKDILAYAIEVGEVEKTRHYLDIYRGRP